MGEVLVVSRFTEAILCGSNHWRQRQGSGGEGVSSWFGVLSQASKRSGEVLVRGELELQLKREVNEYFSCWCSVPMGGCELSEEHSVGVSGNVMC